MAGEANEAKDAPPGGRTIGRYALFDEIASGGMATVHLGRLVGPVGFSRTVAIKQLHPQFAKDPEFVSMFLHEARVASRIQHPNVVTTLDIVTLDSQVFLVMEYVQGESLSHLLRIARSSGENMLPSHAASVMTGVLHGLHAAHEARGERREPLDIVHRDISPQNILVGVDGVGRVLDFGVAKAAWRAQSTREGRLKGKVGYMSPEQLNGQDVDRRADVFAAGVVLWEMLTGARLFDGVDAGEIFGKVLTKPIPEPRSVVADLSEEINWVTMRALERDPAKRFQSAREFAIELEGVGVLATSREVGEWVERIGGAELGRRAQKVADIEGVSTNHALHPSPERSETQAAEERGSRSEPPEIVSSARPRVEEPSSGRTSVSGVSRASISVPNAIEASVPDLPRTIPAPSDELSRPRPSVAPRRARGSMRSGIAALIGSLGGGLLAYVLFAPARALPPAPISAPEPSIPAAQSRAIEPSAEQPANASADEPNARADEEGNRRAAESGETASPGAAETPTTPAPSSLTRVTQSPHRRVLQPGAAPSAAPEPPASSRVAPNCSPPWTIDKTGIRRIKPECL